jgi:glycine cleavage system aminomethyltransferase T
MSVLDFLSPARAVVAGDVRPLARSSLDRHQRDAGATFAERDGWLVPTSIPGESEHLSTVGIADLSHLGKLELSRAASAPDQPVSGSGVVAVHRISPRRSLVLCETARTTALHQSLAEQGGVLDVSAALGVLALVGPEAQTLIRRLTHLHEIPASGELAHVNTVHLLARPDGGVLLVFPQEYGHYLWEVVVDRAEPLGGGPVGVNAIGGAA